MHDQPALSSLLLQSETGQTRLRGAPYRSVVSKLGAPLVNGLHRRECCRADSSKCLLAVAKGQAAP